MQAPVSAACYSTALQVDMNHPYGSDQRHFLLLLLDQGLVGITDHLFSCCNMGIFV